MDPVAARPKHRKEEEEEKEEVVVVVRRRWWFLLVKIEGDPLSTRNTRNTDPVKPRTDESLALCHPWLQQRCSVHPHHPACAQQNGQPFPIGADPSGSFFASS